MYFGGFLGRRVAGSRASLPLEKFEFTGDLFLSSVKTPSSHIICVAKNSSSHASAFHDELLKMYLLSGLTQYGSGIIRTFPLL